MEVNVWGSYYLYKHLTSIKKRQEENCSHTLTLTHTHTHTEQNTWEKWPEGGSTAPRNKQLSVQEEGKTTGGERRHYSMLGEDQGTVRVAVMQGRPAPQTSPLDNNQSVWGGGAGDRAPPVLEKAEPGRRCAALDIFVCQVELGLFFSSVLCWAGLRYQSRVVVVLASAGLCCGGCCCCCCCCWFTVDLGWSLSGRHELSTFPLPSGATPRPWRCRCPWGVLISSASTGALYAGFFRSGHMEMREHSAHTLTVLHCRFTLQ